nr:MAG TPA: minor tail protein [Caudoviricetes sp.]
MAKNLELNIVLGAAVAGAINGMSQVANALKNTTKSVKEFEKEIKSMEKAQRAFQNMDKARDGLNKINSEYKKAAEHLQKLKDEYEKTGSSNKQLAKEIEQAEKNVGKLNKQKERQQHVFEAARSKIEAEGASLSNYRSKVQEVEKEIEKMNKLKAAQGRYEARQENIGKLKEFGDRQLTQGMGMAGALAVPVKLAVDLENAQADLRKVANFGEGEAGKKLALEFNQAMRNFSENSPLSQVELFQIAGAGAQAGINTGELERYTKDAAKIKVAFDMNTEAAGNFLAKTRAQLNLDQNGVMQYADVINYLANTVAVTAPEVADISSRVAGLGGMAGISKEGVAALGASLVSVGVPSEVAATGLKNISLGLMAGTSATKKQAAAFKSLGLDAEDVAKRMTKDGEGTLIDVFQRIKKLPKDVQAATLKELFGKESIQSASELAKHIDEVSKNMKNAHDRAKTAGSVDKEYNQRLKTMGNAFSTLKNRVVNMGVDLGSALGPSLVQVANSIGPLIKKFSQFIQKHPQLTTNILKGVAALAAFKIGIGGLTKGFAPLFSSISKGMLIFDKFKAAGSFAEGFKTAFPTISKIGSGLKKLGQSGLKVGKVLGKGLVKGVQATGKVAKIAGSGIVKGAKFVGSGAIKGAKAIGSGAKAVGGMAVQGAAKGMQLLATGAQKAIGAVRAVGIALKVAFMANPVGFIIAAIVAVVVILVVLYNKCSWFRNGVNAIFRAVGNFIKQVWQGIKPVVMAVISGIAAYIRVYVAVWKAIFKTIGIVAKAVWNAIKAAALALWDGLKSGITAVGSFFKSTWEGIKGAAIAVWNGIKSAFDAVASGLKSAISGVVKFFTDKWNGLKNMVSKGLGAVGGLLGFGKNAAGTNYWSGGLTTVAERGAELIQIPGKPAFLAESEMLLNLPKGTRILNNSQTRSTLRDKVANLKDRVNNLKGGNSYGGNNYSITINVNGGNPSEVERIVRKVIAGDINKRERTAYG